MRAIAGAVCGLLVGATVMGGAALASAPGDASGVMTACAKKKGGDLRLVKAGQRCKRTEKRVNWNQRGKRGPRGPSTLPASYGVGDGDMSLDIAPGDSVSLGSFLPPSGSYLWNAFVTGSSDGPGRLECDLAGGWVFNDKYDVYVFDRASVGGVTITAPGSGDTGDGPTRLRCTAVGTTVTISHFVVTAIPMGRGQEMPKP